MQPKLLLDSSKEHLKFRRIGSNKGFRSAIVTPSDYPATDASRGGAVKVENRLIEVMVIGNLDNKLAKNDYIAHTFGCQVRF